MMVTLPWPGPGLSPNARLHRMAIARLRRAARFNAWATCLEQGVRKVAAERVDVTITFRPPDRRRVDTDNLVARCKATIDGVADAIGVDDSRWRMTFERGEPVKGGAVVFQIAAREA